MEGSNPWRNEEEWRKVIFAELRDIKREQIKQGKEIEHMKVWTWINRVIVGSALTFLFHKVFGSTH